MVVYCIYFIGPSCSKEDLVQCKSRFSYHDRPYALIGVNPGLSLMKFQTRCLHDQPAITSSQCQGLAAMKFPNMQNGTAVHLKYLVNRFCWCIPLILQLHFHCLQFSFSFSLFLELLSLKKKYIYLYPNNQLVLTEVTIKYTHQHDTNSENALLKQNVTNYFAE